MKTKHLTAAALLTALSVVLLYLAGIAPTGKLALTAIAALLPAAAVVSCGLGWGVMTYAAAAILALVLLPNKACALLYALVLGHYGVLKSLIERLHSLPAEWALKLAVFNATAAALFFLFQSAFLDLVSLDRLPLAALWLGLNAAFVLYDLGFSRLIAFYVDRIDRFLR